MVRSSVEVEVEMISNDLRAMITKEAEHAARCMLWNDTAGCSFRREWSQRLTQEGRAFYHAEVSRLFQEYADAAPRETFR